MTVLLGRHVETKTITIWIRHSFIWWWPFFLSFGCLKWWNTQGREGITSSGSVQEPWRCGTEGHSGHGGLVVGLDNLCGLFQP